MGGGGWGKSLGGQASRGGRVVDGPEEKASRGCGGAAGVIGRAPGFGVLGPGSRASCCLPCGVELLC
jgi:hypothetical protein